MLSVRKIVLPVFLILAFIGISQSNSEKLKMEQQKLEEKINNTKMLLNKLQSNTEASLNELRIIENQVRFREELVRNFDNQVRRAEASISGKGRQIQELERKLTVMKEQYKKLLLFAYKNRNQYGKLMYLFSSDNYFEALKRKKYLDKVAVLQEKQFFIIRQNQKLIGDEIDEIDRVKKEKESLLNVKKKEKNSILADKQKKKGMYDDFRDQAQSVREQLVEEEKRKQNLKNEIDLAIKREIAEAEKKRKEEERLRRLAAANAAKANVPSTVPTAALNEVKELALVGKNFEANRGRLPWPVDKGTITENYGRNAHPTLDNVFTNNNGIDVSAPKNAEVRAVFEGEVTSVLNIPGAGKVVILKHGDYRTVYSNLQDSYVSVGMKVDTKQAIGSLLLKPGNSLSVIHFEIHKVSGSSVQSVNPASWVAR
jgi:septal ring factor EnvC (AmiA/AmiB activator)